MDVLQWAKPVDGDKIVLSYLHDVKVLLLFHIFSRHYLMTENYSNFVIHRVHCKSIILKRVKQFVRSHFQSVKLLNSVGIKKSRKSFINFSHF